MAYKRTSGGKNLCELFAISSDHGTLTTPFEIAFDGTIKTSGGGDSLSLESVKNDSELSTFLNTYAHANAADEEPESYFLEDSTEQEGLGGSSGAQQFLAIVYGGENADGVHVTHYIGTVTAESFDQEHNKDTRRNITLNLRKAQQAVTVAIAAYNTGKVAAPGAAITFPVDAIMHEEWMTAA